MPTILTHPAVPLAVGLGLGRKVISRRLLICGAIGSILPDFDVVAFRLGVPYAAEFGHRGFSHSLLFAFTVALLGACCGRYLHSTFLRTFAFLFLAIASHGILDMFTDGGLGIALFWPYSDQRYFMPMQVIAVSPLSLDRIFSDRGAAVLQSELLWVWLPSMSISLLIAIVRFTLFKARTYAVKIRKILNNATT